MFEIKIVSDGTASRDQMTKKALPLLLRGTRSGDTSASKSNNATGERRLTTVPDGQKTDVGKVKRFEVRPFLIPLTHHEYGSTHEPQNKGESRGRCESKPQSLFFGSCLNLESCQYMHN